MQKEEEKLQDPGVCTDKFMLLEKIQEDLKQAQLSREEIKVSTLRLLISEIKNASINKGGELSDEDIISTIQREVKKRNESITAFRIGAREDLASKEESEIAILKPYLPEAMSDEELVKIIDESIKSTGATTISDMGKVMGVVMGKTKGRADGNTVSSMVKERLDNLKS